MLAIHGSGSADSLMAAAAGLDLIAAVAGWALTAAEVSAATVATICSAIGLPRDTRGTRRHALLLYMIFRPQKNPMQQFTSDYARPRGLLYAVRVGNRSLHGVCAGRGAAADGLLVRSQCEHEPGNCAVGGERRHHSPGSCAILRLRISVFVSSDAGDPVGAETGGGRPTTSLNAARHGIAPRSGRLADKACRQLDFVLN